MNTVPAKDRRVSNMQANDLLIRAFEFIPGRTICFSYEINGKVWLAKWEINTNEYNIPYVKCKETGAVAYFSNDGNLFFFRHYEGKKGTLLYYFFLAAFKIPLGYYMDMEIADHYPLNLVTSRHLLFLQDFLAPFVKFLRSDFRLNYDYIDNERMTTLVRFSTKADNYFSGRRSSGYKFMIEINEKGISQFTVEGSETKITASPCQES